MVQGCLESPEAPDLPELPGVDNEEIVRANVAIVRGAVEAFAAANSGMYPADVDGDTTPAGDTVVDLIGQLLPNPYTLQQSEPRNGLADEPGEIGYVQVMIGGAPSSFIINGWGDEAEIAREDNIDELEAVTIATAELVRDAAEAFAADNYGLYPGHVSDVNRDGKTLVDYLPNAILQMNVFTFANTEPVDGTAAQQGEVGYSPSSSQGFALGYTVTAAGYAHQSIFTYDVPLPNAMDAAVLANCYRTIEAAEQWALDSGGTFPNDVSTDTTPGGDTLIDLLGGTRLPNPYTQANTEPGTHSAAIQGETGYLPIKQGGLNTGFIITGYGESDLIFTVSNLDTF